MNLESLSRVVLSYVFAIVLSILCFWFLYLAFLDPNVAALPQDQQSVFVAGIFGLLGSATTYVFTTSSASNAARQAEHATQAGVNAALTGPSVTATAGPPAEVTVDPPTTVPPGNGAQG